jgi:hypothetical protein
VRHLCTPGELEVFDTNARMVPKDRGFPASRSNTEFLGR